MNYSLELPFDLYRLIFNHTDLRTLCRVCSTCHDFYRIVKDIFETNLLSVAITTTIMNGNISIGYASTCDEPIILGNMNKEYSKNTHITYTYYLMTIDIFKNYLSSNIKSSNLYRKYGNGIFNCLDSPVLNINFCKISSKGINYRIDDLLLSHQNESLKQCIIHCGQIYVIASDNTPPLPHNNCTKCSEKAVYFPKSDNIYKLNAHEVICGKCLIKYAYIVND